MKFKSLNTTIYNILSNAFARLWGVFINLAFLPIYTNILGFEAYGLVGFYSMLIGSLSILDMGLSSTLSRELARSLALQTPAKNIRNLVYSFEIIYWIVGIVLGLVIFVLAPFITAYWINIDKLSVQDVTNAIRLMGLVIAFQWPCSIYTGGLMGLQRQVSYNILNIITSTLKAVGVIGVLKYINPTITSFFLWQVIVTIITVVALRYLLWRFLPLYKSKVQFSKEELKKVWRFAAGMTGISLATFCLSQIDKVVLSKFLSLKDYGYYSLAWTIGTSILLIVGVLGSALLPKLTEIVASGDKQEIINSYHRFNKLVASLVVPLGILLILFSKEIILLWSQSIETTNAIWLSVSILTAGSLCNAFMHIPYYLMLAHGWTKFTIYQNTIASIILMPLLYFGVTKWGFVGATLVWFFVNFGYNIISLPLIHQKLLKGELRRVYLNDMGIALLTSVLCFGFMHFILVNVTNTYIILGGLFLAVGFTYILLVSFSPEYKFFILSFFKKQFYEK